MSRIGKLPVELPEGVKAEVTGTLIKVSGPKGSLEREVPKRLTVSVSDRKIVVEAVGGDRQTKALHGTYRALIANMVKGVSEGFTKNLEIVGTGYRAEAKGNILVLIVGFSHPVELAIPEGLELKVEKTKITVSGIDRQLVGQFAAEVRDVKKPEPYKGKGIRYEDEVVRRKAGKAAKTEGAV